ncbi:hypothetical protein L6452_13446 [Arctium lappa]|uniref:Uncharacterized protein n=1 Tax=Arctium lappa TaxID=4217 RepID=A0ACB9CI87_ARCLA|nr:hypothetical protein L6452_13446 [Arctium lappa]
MLYRLIMIEIWFFVCLHKILFSVLPFFVFSLLFVSNDDFKFVFPRIYQCSEATRQCFRCLMALWRSGLALMKFRVYYLSLKISVLEFVSLLLALKVVIFSTTLFHLIHGLVTLDDHAWRRVCWSFEVKVHSGTVSLLLQLFFIRLLARKGLISGVSSLSA